MRPVHSDFSAAFAPGNAFLVSGIRSVAEVRCVGELKLGDEGLVVFGADDPFRRVSRFARHVPRGVHPVELSIVRGDNSASVACGRVRFSAEAAVRWEFALREGDDPDTLKEGEFFGFGVADVPIPIAVYADSRGAAELMREEGGDDAPAPAPAPQSRRARAMDGAAAEARRELELLKQAIERSSQRDVRHASISFPHGGSAVGFQLSDSGYFGSYWGISAAGNVVALATDFNALLENDWEETTVAVRDLPIGPLPLPPRFTRFGTVSLVDRGEFLLLRTTGPREALDLRGDALRGKRAVASSRTTDFLFDRNAVSVRIVAHFGLKPVSRVR